ncbi:MAG: DUF4339 domain-containing protein [Pirellulaceae bacterium]|nr:DUF4339 domain-containing protein [Planctomycetales bacterium]MCA9203682.1 DUF4339 domain-containing protein [Planctomycetales bacterium]MCA9210611.1 DUF4339 domain-containing protein [Planctomycetales bacterium]
MATEWFYQTLGQVVGPLTSSELLRDIRSGKLGHDTPVRKDDSQWVSACDVNGLLEAAVRDVVEFRCPFCNTKVSKPPVVCTGCDRRIEQTYLIKSAFPSLAGRTAAASPTVSSQPNVKQWALSLFRRPK